MSVRGVVAEKLVLGTVSAQKAPTLGRFAKTSLRAIRQIGFHVVRPRQLERYNSYDFIGRRGFSSPDTWPLPDAHDCMAGAPFYQAARADLKWQYGRVETPRQTFERELKHAYDFASPAKQTMIEKGELLISLDSASYRPDRESLSRLPELLSELKPSRIELVVEDDKLGPQSQKFMCLKIKLHVADVRAILSQEREED